MTRKKLVPDQIILCIVLLMKTTLDDRGLKTHIVKPVQGCELAYLFFNKFLKSSEII
jgi:hypothetical protein